jgi:putative photosynthetic complex assembly protein
MSEAHRHDVVLPRSAIIGAGLLVVLAIVAAAVTRFTGNVDSLRPAAIVTAERALRFEDRDDGAVLVFDMRTSRQVATLAPGTNGFMRGVLRGLVRERRSRDIGGDRPFVLTRWSDGHLTVTDSATGRRIELRAFGPTNEQAFLPLLAGNGTADLRTAARE